MTRFAVTSRYPSVTEPVTEGEYARAVAIAAEVVEWAEGRIGDEKSDDA